MAKILIIDDNQEMRDMVARIVKVGGHEAICACDGREGVKAFHAHRPALVVTDIVMPNQEGIATIREIHAAGPDVPIVAISGSGSNSGISYLKMAQKLGARATLSKPFRAGELLELIRQMLPDPA